MLRPETKLAFLKTADGARLSGKKEYDWFCVIDGHQYPFDLQGAHIFPASNFPELAKCKQNILPINEKYHSHRGIDCLDYTISGDTRRPIARLEWLKNAVCGDFRGRVHDQLALLITEGAKISREVSAMYSDLIEVLAGWDE